ncbi:hypothetical protein GCM10022199_08110 [Marihabitans asiaticum]|uniref:Uncharacterized protein n=1 Tax=Marihabitans asiaticum TaxID=415218 RepID=A0A560WGQ5_9MICO|nr:hypothetical protein [Marihabitans asiaticum]TWD16842.1 hypothetical protein FB557_0385 [Marihabitans asiaticum]
MENNTEARDSLAALDADRAALADRTRMPTWYHALVGTTAAALVLMGLVPDDWSGFVMPVAVAIWVGLMLYPPRRSGVAMSSWSAPMILLALIFLLALIIVIVIANVIATQLSAWWLIVPAVLAFGAGWWLSVTSERLTRRELTRER